MTADADLTLCVDCGIDAWAQGPRHAHEDFYVHDELWDSVCPDDRRRERELPGGIVDDPKPGEGGGFVLCIGCFEARLGRRLRRADFKVPPRFLSGCAPSARFMSRWAAR